MRESLLVRFLYKTVPGRMMLKILSCPFVSRISAVFLSSRLSSFFVPGFIEKNGIDMSGYVIPEGGYSSFNDFFTREKKEPLRIWDKSCLVSPCDGLLSVISIDEDTLFRIKGSAYSVRSLLRSGKLSERFSGGTALIFRLTPAHYHRYVFAADGTVVFRKKIKGLLHCVRPAALETIPVFTENSREYSVIRSKEYGTVIQMEVGAMLVGKISNGSHSEPFHRIYAGEYKGYFEFGGSTIIILLDHKVRLNSEIIGRKKKDTEIPVRINEILT